MEANEHHQHSRVRIAYRIHDLLLQELGEDMDVSLMLGPPEYARAVLSVCRSCGSAELTRLVEQFLRASAVEAQLQTQRRLSEPSGIPSDWAPHLPPLNDGLADNPGSGPLAR